MTAQTQLFENDLLGGVPALFLLLVPSVALLLGEHNWWPARLLPHKSAKAV